MEAMIDQNGYLLIKRKGTFRNQTCPFDDNDYPCGHQCPLFLEDEGGEAINKFGCQQVVILSCGYGDPVHEIVKDEREEATPDAE